MSFHKKSEYWLISVPRQNKDQFNEIKQCCGELITDSVRFKIPGTNPTEENAGLRVGKFDSLITLSDEMRKLDHHVEATTRKIASQYLELNEEMKTLPQEFDVKGASPQNFLTKFQWEKARLNVKKSLPELVRIIEVGVAKIDAELRSKNTEYNALAGRLRQIKQSTEGNLLTRDITKEMETSKMIPFESKFLQALFVVVPSSQITEWLKSYESLTEFVVPESAELLCAENDFSLYKVVLFKHVADEFKQKAKEKRCVVRKYDPTNVTSQVEIAKLQQKYDKLRNGLLRWIQTNFGEAYFLWVHLKAIQCYVESILRFGLPADFEVVLVQPSKDVATQVEKRLRAKFQHLEKLFGDDEDEEGDDEGRAHEDKYFPYVFLEMPVSFF
jgi:V-type H+-transporting ATPase subunit C